MAYAAACQQFPDLMRKGPEGEIKIDKDDPRYRETLRLVAGGGPIEDAMQNLLDREKIRKDLIFMEKSDANIGLVYAVGTNIFLKYAALIFVAPGFYKVDKDACSWVVKHEISHIKNSDPFTRHGVSAINSLAASIFGFCFFSFPIQIILAMIADFVSYVLFSKWQEAAADDFAIKNGSNEELKGGRRFLLAMRDVNIEKRSTSFLNKLMISVSGEVRLDILHPSLASRIKKIEKALSDRGVVKIDELEDNQKLNKLKSYMLKNDYTEDSEFEERMRDHFGKKAETA